MKIKAAFAFGMFGLFGILLVAGVLMLPTGGMDNQSVIVDIERGASLNRIAINLEKKGLVKSASLFKWSAIFLGKRKSIKSGEYEIKGRVSVLALIQQLVQGNTLLKKVTIPEGLRMEEIFQVLSDAGLGSVNDYRRLCFQPEFIQSLGFNSGISSLEGFLFPETYLFSKQISPQSVLRTMVKFFSKNVPENYGDLAKSVNLSYYEAVILASIIEKETGVPSERRLIASVFHNRLKQDMKLQTDPTVIYGISNFDGNLTRLQLRTHSAYNTYMVKGLPPTPIASPGLDALMAAVKPAKTDYLYFVAKGDGTHHFTSNYNDHKRAVTKYQKQPRPNYKSF